MKKIKFLPEFIGLILSGDKVQTRRPIRGHDVNAQLNNYFKDTPYCIENRKKDSYTLPRIIEEYAKYKIGEVLYVPEEWIFDHVYNKGVVTRSSMESALPLASERIKFKSADIMPWEYAKTFIKITDIQVERLQDIENNDIALHEEGIRNDVPNMLSEQSRLDDKNRKFKNIWNDIYFQKGFGWNSNPWVFVYTFERTRRIG